MPSETPTNEHTISLTILEEGRINKVWFSQGELANYSAEIKRPRVDLSGLDDTLEPKMPDGAFSDIVKKITTDLFFGEDSAESEKGLAGIQEDLESYPDFLSTDQNEMLELDGTDEVSEAEEEVNTIEKQLEEYVKNEDFGNAAKLKQEIEEQKQKDSDEDQEDQTNDEE